MARPSHQLPSFTVVTGGQTGVDRAALDAALALGIAVDGWCPRGRQASDGVIAAQYPLRETPSGDHAERTTWNVRDSDALLILGPEKLFGGTALAAEMAHRYGRPVLHVGTDPEAANSILAWLRRYQPRLLNIAGPREDDCAGIYEAVRALLTTVLSDYVPQQ